MDIITYLFVCTDKKISYHILTDKKISDNVNATDKYLSATKGGEKNEIKLEKTKTCNGL